MGNLNLWKLGFSTEDRKYESQTTNQGGDEETSLNTSRPNHVHQFEGHTAAITAIHFKSSGA
jgi:hypothetical protein